MASNSLCLVSEMSKALIRTSIIYKMSDVRNASNKVTLTTTGAYGMVRHPAMSCLMAVFLITPTMVPTFMCVLIIIVLM